MTTAGDDQPGAASYRMAPAPPGGFTLMGSPTVIADIAGASATSQIAARLLDVAPDGAADAGRTRRLAAGGREHVRCARCSSCIRTDGGSRRATWRSSSCSQRTRRTRRHRTRRRDITVQNLELRLPVREEPGALGGLVHVPAAKVLPPGEQLARDFWPPPYARPKAATPMAVSLVPAFLRVLRAERDARAAARLRRMRPPRPSRSHLTVGTPDVNGAEAQFVGTVKLGGPGRRSRDRRPTRPTCSFDVQVTDVRAPAGSDRLHGRAARALGLRITDRLGDGAGRRADDGAGLAPST